MILTERLNLNRGVETSKTNYGKLFTNSKISKTLPHFVWRFYYPMVSFTFHGVLKPGYYFHVTWTSTKRSSKWKAKLISVQFFTAFRERERRTNSFCTTGPFRWITNYWKLSRWHRRCWCFAKLQPEQCRNIQIKVHRDSRISEMLFFFFLILDCVCLMECFSQYRLCIFGV